MAAQMMTNYSTTRIRIPVWLVLSLFPATRFHTPSRTTATIAASTMTKA
jgi:hypothetical protein